MSANGEIAIAILAGLVMLAIAVAGAVFVMGIERIAGRSKLRAAAGNAPGPSPRELLWRALCLKCPFCGRAKILKSYFRINRQCPACETVFWEEEGDQLGPMVVDCSVATAAGFAAWAALVFLGYSEVAQLFVAVAAVVASVLLLGPWSRSFWALFLYVSGATEPDRQPTGTAQ